MEQIELAQVRELTGLSPHQVREWTVRRSLVAPDLLPNGPGSRTKFGWKSVLLLRLLAHLHMGFGIGLEPARPVIDGLRRQLRAASFISLWDCFVIIGDDASVEIRGALPTERAFVVIPLNEHLQVISDGFRKLVPARQLPLLASVGRQKA